MAITNKPKFNSAIPQRRYQYGDYIVTILGDIESAGDVTYKFIVAVMLETDPEPGLYITLEDSLANAKPGEKTVGEAERYQMQLIMQDGEQMISSDAILPKLEDFSNKALDVVATLLDLKKLEPYLLG